MTILKFLLRAAMAFLLLALAAGAALAFGAQYLFQKPALAVLVEYSEKELPWARDSHPQFARILYLVQRFFPPSETMQTPPLAGGLGLGPNDAPLFGAAGASPDFKAVSSKGPVVIVRDAAQLTAAIAAAQPGQQIVIAPGSYYLEARSIPVTRSGSPDAPITVRAERLGGVLLKFGMVEGFWLQAPNWVFENLVIEGACGSDDSCEHAFHIVGKARNIVLRNNVIRDFNAHIKINALMADGDIPDHGRIEHNTLYNSRPRETGNPTAAIDLVAASHWQVTGNVIADSGKADGLGYGYAAYFKGAGQGNLMERNLVICAWRHQSRQRVGLSLGGGGTGQEFCADGKCAAEQTGGIVRNNIIAHCDDSGIYLNRSAGSLIANNLLYRTRGIDARFPETDALIANNIIDGRILVRDGARVSEQKNLNSIWDAGLLRSMAEQVLANPGQGDFHWRGAAKAGAPLDNGAGPDFCGAAPDAAHPVIGPFAAATGAACAKTIVIPGQKTAH